MDLKLTKLIHSNHLWNEDRQRTKFEAFLDLYLMAAHPKMKAVWHDKEVSYKAGVIISSVRELGRRWAWSRNKVLGLLKELTSHGDITWETNNINIKITIENFDESVMAKPDPVDRETMGLINEIKDHWNAQPRLPQVRVVTGRRRDHMKARLKEKEFRRHWREAIEMVNNNDFCCGGGNRAWQATLDWFVKNPLNYIKILEEKFKVRESLETPHEQTSATAEYLKSRQAVHQQVRTDTRRPSDDNKTAGPSVQPQWKMLPGQTADSG